MYNPNIHNRCSSRIQNHDYSIGRYFITITINSRLPLFGRIVEDSMMKNDAALMIEMNWLDSILRFPNIVLDSFIVMPEHFHGIVDLGDNRKLTHNLYDILRYFKSQTTLDYKKGVRESNWQGFNKRLWQRNYFEHYINNDIELTNIREYIKNNPADYQRTMFEDF